MNDITLVFVGAGILFSGVVNGMDDNLDEYFVGTPRTKAGKIYDYARKKECDQPESMYSPDWSSYMDIDSVLLSQHLHQEQKDLFLLRAAGAGNSENVQKLLACGAIISETTSSGYNALHIAVYHGHGEVVEQLLDCVLDINVLTQSSKRETALHIAVRMGHTDIVALLLASGADTTIKDRFSYKPKDFVKNWWRDSRYWGEIQDKHEIRRLFDQYQNNHDTELDEKSD